MKIAVKDLKYYYFRLPVCFTAIMPGLIAVFTALALTGFVVYGGAQWVAKMAADLPHSFHSVVATVAADVN